MLRGSTLFAFRDALPRHYNSTRYQFAARVRTTVIVTIVITFCRYFSGRCSNINIDGFRCPRDWIHTSSEYRICNNPFAWMLLDALNPLKHK